MLSIEENKTKKFRNPFPMLGKVYKYEFISTARLLLPLYGALIIAAWVAGLFLKIDIGSFKNIDEAANIMSSGTYKMSTNGVVSGILFTLLWGLAVATTILTFVQIVKRFKKSMLEDEAYLNLTLPVTLGEHVWGRFLCAFTWILIFAVTGILTGTGVGIWFVPLISDAIQQVGGWNILMSRFYFQTNVSFSSFLCMWAVFGITSTFVVILFCYFVNAIAHLAKKKRTLVKILTIILTLVVISRINSIIMTNAFATVMNETDFAFKQFVSVIWITSGLNIMFSAIFMAATHLILQFKLNLE